MAQKRRVFDKKEKLLKNGKKHLSKVLEKKREDSNKEGDDKGGGKGKDEGPASLSWLVNLSAASLFSVPKALPHCDEPIMNEYNTKPGLTYTELIEKALKENGELTVSEIYKWIYTKYPFYKKNDGRWKNSIRHNLSINPQFRKGSKCNNGGHLWGLNKEYDEKFKKWQEHKKCNKKKYNLSKYDADEVEKATRSILLDDDDDSKDCTVSLYQNDPTLVRVANDILNGVEKEVGIELLEDSISAPVIIGEDMMECSDPILSDPMLFSDCLDMGFQPYELL